MSDYAKLEGLNWSSLKHIATSALLYRWRVDNPEPPKPAFAWGGAFHTDVLEPHLFDARYAVYDKIRRGAEWEEWLAESPHLHATFKSHEIEDVRRAAKAVRANPDAAALLLGARTEEPLTWTDPETGIKCKGRVDLFRADRVGDLKSARSVEPREFANAVARHMYHGQLAFYHYGAIAARRIPANAAPPFVIACEKEAPHDVVCYELSYEDLAAGRRLCLDLQAKLMTCLETDYWPGVAPGMQQLQLPSWAPGLESEEIL